MPPRDPIQSLLPSPFFFPFFSLVSSSWRIHTLQLVSSMFQSQVLLCHLSPYKAIDLSTCSKTYKQEDHHSDFIGSQNFTREMKDMK